MIFLSTPHVWHLAGTWSDKLPVDQTLSGLTPDQLMMVLHSIFVPLIFVLLTYWFLTIKDYRQRDGINT